jgi:hypothetical protein
LFERIDSHDPSALIGLPLITLANWLTDLGLLLTTLSAQVKTKTPTTKQNTTGHL